MSTTGVEAGERASDIVRIEGRLFLLTDRGRIYLLGQKKWDLSDFREAMRQFKARLSLRSLRARITGEVRFADGHSEALLDDGTTRSWTELGVNL